MSGKSSRRAMTRGRPSIGEEQQADALPRPDEMTRTLRCPCSDIDDEQIGLLAASALMQADGTAAMALDVAGCGPGVLRPKLADEDRPGEARQPLGHDAHQPARGVDEDATALLVSSATIGASPPVVTRYPNGFGSDYDGFSMVTSKLPSRSSTTRVW